MWCILKRIYNPLPPIWYFFCTKEMPNLVLYAHFNILELNVLFSCCAFETLIVCELPLQIWKEIKHCAALMHNLRIFRGFLLEFSLFYRFLLPETSNYCRFQIQYHSIKQWKTKSSHECVCACVGVWVQLWLQMFVSLQIMCKHKKFNLMNHNTTNPKTGFSTKPKTDVYAHLNK